MALKHSLGLAFSDQISIISRSGIFTIPCAEEYLDWYFKRQTLSLTTSFLSEGNNIFTGIPDDKRYL